jgi:acyl-CoA thioester hydrolase
MEHRLPVKVYYEDTDSLGMVYHANYLKYMERGRSEYVGLLGTSIKELNSAGYAIVVYAMEIRFRRAAELGDELEVVSSFRLASPYRGVFRQRVERRGELIVEAEVEIVCLDDRRKLRAFPPELTDAQE